MEFNLDNSTNDLVAENTKFKEFAELLESINKIDMSNNSHRNSTKTDQKKDLLKKFFEKWRTRGEQLSQSNSNLFPFIRLLLPDNDRRIYNIKEAKLAQFLIKAFSIADTSNDAQSLRNYKAPSSVKAEGDFATVAFFALKSRCTESTLTIKEINDYLDKISINNSKGKEGQSEIIKSFTHLCLNLSAFQLKWLIRIILKDLKIGTAEKLVFDAFHPDANELYKVNASLEDVCLKLNDPTVRSNEIGVKIDIPCCPMLGERAKPNQIETKLGKKEFYIEQKLDGERFHLHKNGSKYTYFSRNRHNYTDGFGADASSGSLTPYIHDQFSPHVKSCILDGEMCFYDMKEKIYLSLTEQYDIKSNKEYENLERCFCVFDLLLLNDTVLTNKPLKERIEYLNKCFTDLEGRIVMIKRQSASTNKQVAEALNNAIDNRQEGIVVKDPDSVYKPDLRGGSGWFKVKPDYMLGLNDDLDLLIVGGYHGTGRRGGLLSHFLLAVAVHDPNDKPKKFNSTHNGDDDLDLAGDDNDDDQFFDCNESKGSQNVVHPKLFYSFCKIGSGYTYKELFDFNMKLQDKWKPYDKKNPPEHLQVTIEKPDFWIEPSDSYIVQVKAVEIVNSEKYKTGCSLRFPRLDRIRDKTDKDWYNCMTLDELNELREKNDGKLASGKHLELSDDDENNDEYEPKNKKKRTINKRTIVQVSDRFKGVDPSMVNKESELFQNKEFCVVGDGNETYSKKALETKILEHGGKTVQNPCSTTFCVIAAKLISKCKPYQEKDLYDIVKIDWLINCIKSKRFLQFKPSDFLYCTNETKNYLKKIYDEFGDDFKQDHTIASLKELFSSLNTNPNYMKLKFDKLREQIAEFEDEYLPNDFIHFRIFRLDNIYLDFYETVNDSSKRVKYSYLDLIELKIKWHGGLVVKRIDENTTHCVIDKNKITRLESIKELNRKPNRKLFHIVSHDWVNDCIRANKKLNELSYHM